jgi:hypothetical protein
MSTNIARWSDDWQTYEGFSVQKARRIGALGSIPFYVSDAAVQTIRNMVWSGAGTYAAHNRIGYTTLVEATGSDADTISFEMLLSANLGVNPWDAITALLNAERNQYHMQLTIGNHGYGRYKWLIASHSIKMEKFDIYGNLTEAVVSIKLVEYLKE